MERCNHHIIRTVTFGAHLSWEGDIPKPTTKNQSNRPKYVNTICAVCTMLPTGYNTDPSARSHPASLESVCSAGYTRITNDIHFTGNVLLFVVRLFVV